MKRARRRLAHARRRRRKLGERLIRRELGDANRILALKVERIEEGVAHVTATIQPMGYARDLVVACEFR